MEACYVYFIIVSIIYRLSSLGKKNPYSKHEGKKGLYSKEKIRKYIGNVIIQSIFSSLSKRRALAISQSMIKRIQLSTRSFHARGNVEDLLKRRIGIFLFFIRCEVPLCFLVWLTSSGLQSIQSRKKKRTVKA